jgi:hypothetical protein
MLSSQFDPDPKARPMFDTVSHQPCKRARASIFLPTGPWLGPSRAVGYAFYSFYRAMMRRSVLFMCFMPPAAVFYAFHAFYAFYVLAVYFQCFVFHNQARGTCIGGPCYRNVMAQTRTPAFRGRALLRAGKLGPQIFSMSMLMVIVTLISPQSRKKLKKADR